jgi:hypothetical protein
MKSTIFWDVTPRKGTHLPELSSLRFMEQLPPFIFQRNAYSAYRWRTSTSHWYLCHFSPVLLRATFLYFLAPTG